MNTLYFGDCLDILKELHRENSTGFIDLIYIDPPFNSKRDYNILFEDAVDIKDATAQKQAFADTWSNVSYYDSLSELQDIDLNLHTFLTTLDRLNTSKSAVSYLTTMAIRILYMHKVLKDTGSFYLHCDSTMSHYLKIVCDIIFGEKNFRNNIVWCYKEREISKSQWNKKHDDILFYTKSEKNIFNWKEVYENYSEGSLKKFNYEDDDGRKFQIRGKGGKYTGEQGLNIGLEKINPELIYRDYLDKSPGVPPRDWWTIPVINRAAKERLGYPTQKPESLLERIIKASSNEGDMVADFFCGCGTTIAVAERLKRNWLGTDISHLAIKLVLKRLTDPYLKNPEKAEEIRKRLQIKGLPKDIASAKELAANTKGGRLEFQDWIIEVMLGGVVNPKKTADGGWDGHITFEEVNDKKETVLIEVKSGKVNVKNVREFIHVIEKQKAKIGVFVCFAEYVTKEMLKETKSQGNYNKGVWGTRYDKIQIITIEDILNGKIIQMPVSTKTTFKKASFNADHVSEQSAIFE
ncbi:MAG: DNA methyltransferase [bacterium]